MPRARLPIRRLVILCHRWLGTAFCLLFCMWFLSGIAMMYWDYPEVGTAERLARSAPLDPGSIRVSPEDAFAALGVDSPPDQVRLAILDGRPAYRFDFGRRESIVYADRLQLQDRTQRDLSLRIASAWTGQPASAARFEGILTSPDQWTVSGEFRPLRPLLKYSWPNGDEVYVSQRTAEVVQATTRASRLGAYFGAIPHWLYFTPLRKNGLVWSRVVIWSSGIGTVTSLLGLIVGIWISVPAQRIPYTGWKRWHAMLGLVFGLVACTWAFSGMLSMDPFDWDAGADAGPQADALRGGDWQPGTFGGKSPAQALAEAGGKVKELELTFFAGDPVYIASESAQQSRVIPVHGSAFDQFDPARVAGVMEASSRLAGVAEVRVVREYERYYIDRHHTRPLPVLFVRLNDRSGSMYYVDLKTARIVASCDQKSRLNRWLYHGLHSMDLPWLYKHRPAWDLLVLTLLLGGSALSVTSVMLGWRLLASKLPNKRRRQPAGAVMKEL